MCNHFRTMTTHHFRPQSCAKSKHRQNNRPPDAVAVMCLRRARKLPVQLRAILNRDPCIKSKGLLRTSGWLEQGLATSQTMLLLPDRWTAWQAQVIGFDLRDCEGGINEPALFSGVDASRFASVSRTISRPTGRLERKLWNWSEKRDVVTDKPLLI